MLRAEQTAEQAPVPAGADAAAANYEELGQGLMLLRASTMKMVRLQLAMERRDRRVALETLDDLVALDGKIRDLLTGMPAGAGDPPVQRQLEEERSALVRERLTLAAGIKGPALGRDQPQWIESVPDPGPAPQPAGPLAAGWEEAAERRSSAFPILVTLFVLAIVAAATAVLLGTTVGQDLLAPLLSGMGAR